jgi:hypothetical protein
MIRRNNKNYYVLYNTEFIARLMFMLSVLALWNYMKTLGMITNKIVNEDWSFFLGGGEMMSSSFLERYPYSR